MSFLSHRKILLHKMSFHWTRGMKELFQYLMLMLLSAILTLAIAESIPTMLAAKLSSATTAANECNAVMNGEVRMTDGKSEIAVIEWQQVEEVR